MQRIQYRGPGRVFRQSGNRRSRELSWLASSHYDVAASIFYSEMSVTFRAHSFPRAAELWAEPLNLAIAVEFYGIPRKHRNSTATAKFRKSVLLLKLWHAVPSDRYTGLLISVMRLLVVKLLLKLLHRFQPNCAQWQRPTNTLCWSSTRKTNPRWRTAAILKNWKSAISSQTFDRLTRNVAWRRVLALRSGPVGKISDF